MGPCDHPYAIRMLATRFSVGPAQTANEKPFFLFWGWSKGIEVVFVRAERFADLRWAGFLPQMFIRRTKLSVTTKLSAEHETPPIANVLLATVVFSSSKVLCL